MPDVSSISSGAAGAAGATASGAAGGAASGGPASLAAATAGLVTCAVSAGDPAQSLDPSIGVVSISIYKEINKIPFARLVILDGDPASADFPISGLATLVPGQKIQVELGYNSNNAIVFQGLIVGHGISVDRKGSSLHLDCRDEAVKMTMVPNSKHYNNITDSDLASQLLAGYGLAGDVSDTTVTNENLVQCSMTDWDFMISRMDRMGMITTVDQGTVTIAAPDPSGSPVLDLEYGTNILECSVQMDARTQVDSVQLSNWDPPTQSVISTGSQYTPPATEEGNISAGDLAAALGIALLDMRSSAAFAPDEAQAVADARQMKNVLSKIQGRVRFQGFGGIVPGDMVTLGGLGDRFNGSAFVSGVRHEYANGNWTTEATLGMSLEWFADRVHARGLSGGGNTPVGSTHPNSATGLFSTLQGLQVGMVSSIVDPDNEFKVQVRMPAVNADDDGIWARVATLDAGDKRGTFFRPEHNDEVIVGFINNDPSQPVILGMMHSSALPATISPSQDNDQKGLTTRSGLSVLFDDGQDSIVISTPGGRQFTLNDDSGAVQLTDGQGNTLRFDSGGVTVQSAGDLTLQAKGNVSIGGAQLSLNGQSSVGLSSVSVSISGSGETSISGAVVKIN
jgi:Rhs element Vgr protein